MAAVSNVSLSITDGSTPEKKAVTVSGMLTFDHSEIGRQYRLEIKLFGEDLAGDNLPSTDPAGDDELYTFMFGNFFKSQYKSITVAAAGSQSFTFTRTISTEKLNEDSGVNTSVIGLPPHIHIKPQTDEVYAKVTLSVAPSSSTARSATVTGSF